jgi:hypothetical protein
LKAIGTTEFFSKVKDRLTRQELLPMGALQSSVLLLSRLSAIESTRNSVIAGLQGVVFQFELLLQSLDAKAVREIDESAISQLYQLFINSAPKTSEFASMREVMRDHWISHFWNQWLSR